MLAAVLGTVALALILIPAGAAGASKKTFTAEIAPKPATAGTSVPFTLTIANDATSPNQLGSANVTPPGGFTITGVTGPAGSGVNTTTNTAELRNLNIAPGQSLSVTITATTPCAINPASKNWSIYAKQANDWNGQPGNNFQPYPALVEQSLGGGCKLAFANQPADTAAKTAVRTAKWGSIDNPAGGDPIKIEVLSGSTVVPGTGTVAMQISGTGCGFTGDSTTTATFGADGFATFSNLKPSSVATGCQLKAVNSSAGYLDSDPSSSFNVDPVKLFFVTQPADAVVNTVLRDAKYGGTALNTQYEGNPIEVGARVESQTDTSTKQLTGSGTVAPAGTVSMQAGGSSGCAFTSDSTTSASFGTGGVASFLNLKMQNVVTDPSSCSLTATGSNPPGYSSATSGSFHVDQSGTICAGSCDTGPVPSPDGNTTDVTVTGFSGTITVNYSTSSLPSDVLTACGSTFTSSSGASASTGVVALEPFTGATLGPNVTVQHTIAKKFLPRPPSQGNPAIPICAGVHRVDLDGSYSSPPAAGTVLPCSTSSQTDGTTLGGWITQSYLPAICTGDGNFWGILGNYTQVPSIQPQDPQITQWLGNPDGSRTFWISLGILQLNQHWFWDYYYRP